MPNLDVMNPHSQSSASQAIANTGEWKPPPVKNNMIKCIQLHKNYCVTDLNNQGHMDSFYTRLLKLSFPDSITAIEYCRELSSQYGFTVKQEASSNRVGSHYLFDS